MQAYHLIGPAGIEDLHPISVPVPSPAAGQVLVRVHALSLNPVDVATTHGQGYYDALRVLDPLIPGWDIAGVVVAVGFGVTSLPLGAAVFGMVNFPAPGGAYAEYVAAPAEQLALKPAAVSFAEAAAAGMAGLTAWQALAKIARVQPGQRVLLHAAAGGVGHLAVQLAKELGAWVVATSSGSSRVFVLALGADEHLDYTRQRFEEVLPPVDLVLDTVGGETTVRSLRILKQGGQLITLHPATNPNLEALAAAYTVRLARFQVAPSGPDLHQLAQRLAAGTLNVQLARTWPFAQLPAALRQVAGNHIHGKVCVTLE